VSLTVATWNVNSVRIRLPRLLAWLQASKPDVVLLQETKVRDEEFPRAPIEALGYAVETFGQKTYNGVAILSRLPVEGVRRGLPDDAADAERRLIAATVGGLRVVGVYVPNGQAVESPKFPYKLEWLRRLRTFLDREQRSDEPLLLLGDFNVAPEDRDVHDPDRWRGQVLFHPREHEALGHVRSFGLADLFRDHTADAGRFTWWDYRMLAFPKDHGLRIDLVLGTESARRRCRAVEIHRDERKGEKPSDHVPVVAVLDA
jgi:exodeoxyribonuclease-3